MNSWPSPPVPPLPGRGEPLALYDTARDGVHETIPDGPARMYVCGITPYDATHLGHAATMITFDLINRSWRDAGQAVSYVQNVTDIDDPLLERATRDREDWVVLAMRETALFREDMAALRILPPEHYVGAVESIPEIAATVARLLDEGAAYVLADGTGDVRVFPHPEMSAAHAEVLTGKCPFSQHYVHAGMIGLSGEKMSKSRGNLVFVSRLGAAHVAPRAVGLALVADHSRADRQWTDD